MRSIVRGPVAIVFTICALISLWIAILGWGVIVPPQTACAIASPPCPAVHWPKIKIFQAGIAVFWIIAPPIWFWIEFFFTDWKGYDFWKSNTDTEKFERFKYGQDISSKIWLAFSTTLLMLYFGKDLHL